MKEFVLLDNSLLLRKSDIAYVEINKEESLMKVVDKYAHEYNILIEKSKFDKLILDFVRECNNDIKLVKLEYTNIFLNIDNISSIEIKKCIFNKNEFYVLDIRWILNYLLPKTFRLDDCKDTDLFELLHIIKDWGV